MCAIIHAKVLPVSVLSIENCDTECKGSWFTIVTSNTLAALLQIPPWVYSRHLSTVDEAIKLLLLWDVICSYMYHISAEKPIQKKTLVYVCKTTLKRWRQNSFESAAEGKRAWWLIYTGLIPWQAGWRPKLARRWIRKQVVLQQRGLGAQQSTSALTHNFISKCSKVN